MTRALEALGALPPPDLRIASKAAGRRALLADGWSFTARVRWAMLAMQQRLLIS